MRDKILILLWRAWHLQENIVHGNGKETISGSVAFLLKCVEEIRATKDKDRSDINHLPRESIWGSETNTASTNHPEVDPSS